MRHYPSPLKQLLYLLQKFPGVGKRTAERYAFDLLEWKEEEMSALALLIDSLKKSLKKCPQCGALTENALCSFCDSHKRETTTLCIVASPRDIFSIESTGSYQGLYYVLNTLLSPMEGKTEEDLHLPKLIKYVEAYPLKEVILALDATLEGDATSLLLQQVLEKEGYSVSKLALGLPMGASLDFIDEGTLSHALTSRIRLMPSKQKPYFEP